VSLQSPVAADATQIIIELKKLFLVPSFQISLESFDSPPSAMQNGQSQTVSPSYTSDQGGCGGESPESFGHSGHTPSAPAPSASYNYFSAHFSPESVRRWLLRNRSAKSTYDYKLFKKSRQIWILWGGSFWTPFDFYNACHSRLIQVWLDKDAVGLQWIGPFASQ